MNTHTIDLYDVTCIEVDGEPFIPTAWGWSPDNQSKVPDCVKVNEPEYVAAVTDNDVSRLTSRSWFSGWFFLERVESAITNDNGRIKETEFNADFRDLVAPVVGLVRPPTDRIYWVEFTEDCECCRDEADR